MFIATIRVICFIIACIGSGLFLHWLISGFVGHSVGSSFHWIVLCSAIGLAYVWRLFRKWESSHY
jgi:hypothetical protein